MMSSSSTTRTSPSLVDPFFQMFLFLFHSLFTLLSHCHLQYVIWSRQLRSLFSLSISSSPTPQKQQQQQQLQSYSLKSLSSSLIRDQCRQILSKRPSHVALVVLEPGQISFKVRELYTLFFMVCSY